MLQVDNGWEAPYLGHSVLAQAVTELADAIFRHCVPLAMLLTKVTVFPSAPGAGIWEGGRPALAVSFPGTSGHQSHSCSSTTAGSCTQPSSCS